MIFFPFAKNSQAVHPVTGRKKFPLFKLFFTWLTLFWGLSFSVPAYGANHYVRQGASGNGSDWTNAYGNLPENLTRGDTYYMADGSYGSYTFDDANSGTQIITVKKAIASDHGTDTGWQASYGDGQAVFGSLIVITPYLLIDGATRIIEPTWTAPTGYGIKATSVEADSSNGQNASYSEFRYIDIGPTYEENPSLSTIGTYDNVVRFVYNQNHITISRCAIHGAVGALFKIHGSSYITIEYCDIGPGWGKEAISSMNVVASNWIIRYNRFWDSSMKDPNDSTSGTTGEIV